MSLDKGNVVVDLKDKSGLKDKLKENGVIKEQLNDFNFEEFDNAIEKSFQDFLKQIKEEIKSHEDISRGALQDRFNKWIDAQCSTLDGIKDNEIYMEIIAPIDFTLTGFSTLRQLDNLDDDINGKEYDLVIHGKNDIKVRTFGINGESIAEIFNENRFENEEKLFQLLESAKIDKKTLASDNIKKFQRIIAGIDENDESKDYSPETKKKLGVGVDGKFGKGTLAAFKRYAQQPAIVPGYSAEFVPERRYTNVFANKVEKPADGFSDEIKKLLDKNTLTVVEAEQIIDEATNKNIYTISFENLNTIDKDVAKVLAGYQGGKINLKSLTTLSEEVLKIFADSNTCKCNMITFNNGKIQKIGNKYIISISKEKKKYQYHDINDPLCNRLLTKKSSTVIGNSNGTVSEGPKVEEIESSGQVVNKQNGGKTNNSKHSTGNIDVQYKTSQTMDKENYSRKYENAKNEKEAIRLLLGLKGFHNQTDDISIGMEGYDINRLQLSDEANKLTILRIVLEQFLKLDELKRASAVFDSFNSIFEQYNQGKKFQGEKSDRISFWNMENYADYVTLNNDGTLKDPDDPFAKAFKRLTWLYEKYQNGEGGAYFNNVMGLLENYFIRGGISLENMQNGGFKKIFEQNNYGKAKGGADLDKLKIDFDETEGSKDKIRYNEKGEKEFMAMLSDFNLDGRLDHNDRGYYMGLELDNIYKSINIDFKNSELSEQVESGQSVWKNIVNFAIDYFENLGDTDTANELKSVSTIDELNTKLKAKKGDEGYKTLKSLQTMLKDSPVPISFICKYGNRAQEMFLNEVMMDEKFDEMYDAAFDELVKQGIDPQLRVGLKPAIYASYINGGIGGGFGAAYDTKNIGTLSMSLGATHVPGSEDLQYGIVLGRSQKEGFNVGSGKIKLGVDAGYSTQGFLALGKADFVSGIANKKKLEAMNADSVKRVNIGASAGWLGNGLYASLKGGMSYDYIEGTINKHNELNSYLRESLAKIFDDEKFKTFFKDGKIDTSKGEEIKGFLREKLGEAGEKDKTVVDAAVENIYSGLMYFSVGLKFDENNEEAFNIAKNRIIYQLSETYTNKYISEHIGEKLDGKLKLTNRSIGPAIFFNGNGVESIANSVYYSVVGGLGFTRYGNTYMTETDQSKASYESRLSSGLGFDYLEGSLDSNGNITQETIDYLNDKLSIIGNYDIEKISMDESTNIIYIPKDLFRGGVNIYLDKNLENFVESDEKGFKIPINTEIALLTRSRTNSTQFDLVIGNYKKEADAIKLTYNSEFKGELEKFTPEDKGEKVFNIEKINNLLDNESEKYPNFPIESCEETENGKFAFTIKEGYNISKNGDNLGIEDGKIIVQKSGKLLIKKTGDGDYAASFENANEGKLTIKYNDGIETSFDFYERHTGLNTVFDEIDEYELYKIIDWKWNDYVSFMEETCDNDDNFINNDDYIEAFDIIKRILNSKDNESLNDIKDKINNITDDNEKILVVDRFKMVFCLINRARSVSSLKKYAKKRGNIYENLKGYATDKNEFPLKELGYREKLISTLGDGNLEKHISKNLVGMTAFYKRGYKDGGHTELYNNQLEQAYGYSMTQIGATDYLGKLYPIEEEHLQNTKNWFIENLKKTEVHKNILKSYIGEKIHATINDEQLYELLKGNEINIDNSSKKVKLDAEYMFYLLGECANESIGVQINNIEIHDTNGGDDSDGLRDEIEITAESNGKRSGVYVGNVEAANRTVLQEVAKFGGGAAVGLGGEPSGGGTGGPTGGGTGHTPPSGGGTGHTY